MYDLKDIFQNYDSSSFYSNFKPERNPTQGLSDFYFNDLFDAKSNYSTKKSSPNLCAPVQGWNKPTLIIKRLPFADFSIAELDCLVGEDLSSRNRVFAAYDLASKRDIVVKFYGSKERARRERIVIEHLQNTSFVDYLPSVIFCGEGVIVELKHSSELVSLYDRVRTLASLHSLDSSLILPSAISLNLDFVLAQIPNLSEFKKRQLNARYAQASDILAESKLVLIHGDAKPENWLGNRLIDWESASFGFKEKDLARLLIDYSLSKQEVYSALFVYQRELDDLQELDFDKSKFEKLVQRFEAARFIEALRKLKTNTNKKRPDKKKLDFLQSLVVV